MSAETYKRTNTWKKYDEKGKLISDRPIDQIPPRAGSVIGERMAEEARKFIDSSPFGKEGRAGAKVVVEEDGEAKQKLRDSKDAAREARLAQMPWLALPDDPLPPPTVVSAPLETAIEAISWGAWRIRLRNKDMVRLKAGDPNLVLFVPADEFSPYLIDLNRYGHHDLALWKVRFEKAKAIYPQECPVPPRTRRRECFVFIKGEEPSEW